MIQHSKSICISCDSRFGTYDGSMEIELCPKCLKSHKPQSARKREEAECHAAIDLVYRRMMERSQIRLGKRLGVF